MMIIIIMIIMIIMIILFVTSKIITECIVRRPSDARPPPPVFGEIAFVEWAAFVHRPLPDCFARLMYT